MADASDAEERWAADLLFGEDPRVAPTAETLTDSAGADANEAESVTRPVDLDADDDLPADDETADEAPRDVNAGAKRTAVLLGAGLVVAVGAISAALLTFGDGSETAAPRTAVPTAVAAPQPVPSTAVPAGEQDQAVPFTASADCPAGSSSAQALTDTTTDSAWVCVRGAQGTAVDGQVLTVTLGEDPQQPRTYVLSAVEVTPGWVPKTPGGEGEWLQHRVVTRLQYIFSNGTETQIFTQDTGNAHGPVTMPLPRPVLASRVKVVVLQTSRPPASPPPADSADAGSGQSGFVASVLGEAGAPLDPAIPSVTEPGGSDPVDYTFAMSSLKFFGHLPN